MSNAFRRAIRPPSDLSPPLWASHNVSIANSERSSKYDIEQTPWWRQPMEDLADPEVQQIVCLAPTGSGKSTFFEGAIPWVVSEAPGPTGYFSQTDAKAKYWGEARLKVALKSCKSLDDLWPEDRHASRKLEIIWPHMPLILGGANYTNFQEVSLQWLFGDEVWRWDHGLVREFLGRHHERWNRKVVMVSQGGFKESELDLEWQKTPQARFAFQCSKCGERIPWQSDQFKYDLIEVNGQVNMEESAATVHHVCPSCELRTQDQTTKRRAMSSSSVYLPQQDGLEGYRGYQVHAGAIWWVPWKRYALGKIEADQQLKKGVALLMQQHVQKRDADFWSDDMAGNVGDVALGDYTVADHADGQPIEGEKARFLTIDAGKDHFWAVVRAWRSDGTSRGLWEGRLLEESQLKDLQTRYNVSPNCVMLDVGYDAPRMHEMIASNGWVGVRGASKESWTHKDNSERLYSRLREPRAPSGRRSRYMFLVVEKLKDMLATLRAGDGFENTRDVSDAYKSHMKGEIKKKEVNRKSGKESFKWVRVGPNHLFDCEVYQVGAALIFGVFEVGANNAES